MALRICVSDVGYLHALRDTVLAMDDQFEIELQKELQAYSPRKNVDELSLRTDRVQGSRSSRTPLRSRKLAASSNAACQGFAQPANLEPRHARRRSASATIPSCRS